MTLIFLLGQDYSLKIFPQCSVHCEDINKSDFTLHLSTPFVDTSFWNELYLHNILDFDHGLNKYFGRFYILFGKHMVSGKGGSPGIWKRI